MAERSSMVIWGWEGSLTKEMSELLGMLDIHYAGCGDGFRNQTCVKTW